MRQLFLEQRQLLNKRQLEYRERCGCTHAGSTSKPCKAGPAEQHHRKDEQADDDRRRQMALQHQQSCCGRENKNKRQYTVTEAFHP